MNKRKFWPTKRTFFLSFVIPFVLATCLYQFVWVEDAKVRTQWSTASSLTLEQEQSRRWGDSATWFIHALVIGVPAGLLSVTIICGSLAAKNYFCSDRNKG
jgi:hypothetical protein